MLTRLKIKGFKNLVDVEIRLGPVTCIVGPNGVGKSNLFDVVHLLSLLADKPFVEAAAEVRGGSNLRDLFTTGGENRMELECDVIIPKVGTDDFGQRAEAAYTYLTYQLSLRYDDVDSATGVPRVRVEREELAYNEKAEAAQRLGFRTSSQWIDSVVHSSSRRTTFIHTNGDHIKLQVDRMKDESTSRPGGGRTIDFSRDHLPRTVLSSAQNAEEHRTAVLLRQEMRRWRQLQLEPSALRSSDDFHSPSSISASGAHVATTLYRLVSSDGPHVYAEVANRLAQLVDGVKLIRVDRDESRRLFRLLMQDLHGVELPASSLSDGTLRFIALAVMEQDPGATGVVCLEEPENGIHPQRVEAMLRLLGDMAVDPLEDVDEANPLRQVLMSTHSPLVVHDAAADDVVFAEARTHQLGLRTVRGLRFRGIEGTWRANIDMGASADDGVSKGAILAYLQPQSRDDEEDDEPVATRRRKVKELVGRGGRQMDLDLRSPPEH